MVKQSSLINLNCSYTGIVSKQPNKFYNSKNQMNKELLLDNSVFALFYSLKDAIFSSNNFPANFSPISYKFH